MRGKNLVLNGVNIQWPWSQLISTGQKVVETRSYPIPSKHLNHPLALIETPGRKGKHLGINRARIIAVITFIDCFQYENRTDWLDDFSRHLVDPDDKNFGFNPLKKKWGWIIGEVTPIFPYCKAPEKKGIIFATDCKIDLSKTPSFTLPAYASLMDI